MPFQLLNHQTEVVIIGAGPTGLSMAIQLMRYNISFVILEKNQHTTPFSKALVVQARTMEIFDELGLAEQAIELGRITEALNMFEHGKKKVDVELKRLGEGISSFPFALSLEQSKTETMLVDYLAVHGNTIGWESAFTRFEETGKGIKVFYTKAGTEYCIDAQYLVAADGAGSPVRHQLQLPFEGDTLPKVFYVSDVLLESSVIREDRLYMFLIERGFILFFPMKGDGHYRVIGILPDAKENDLPPNFGSLVPYIQEQVDAPLSFKEIKWFSSYKVHTRKAIHFGKGRCFLAGDAAHIHTPAGGQGMNTGIQDAYNLAWKMALTLQNKVNPAVLESYKAEREENAANLLKTTDRMFDIMSGSNIFWNFLRLHVLPRVASFVTRNNRLKKILFPLISQTAITYRHTALVIKSSIGRVEAGVRMPYFVLENGQQVFELLKDPCFKIVFFGDQNDNLFPAIIQASFEIKKIYIKEIPNHLFGAHQSFYILLRPDNHIAYIGTSIDTCNQFIASLTT